MGQCAPDLIRGERLRQVVKGAAPHRLDGCVNGGKGGEDDDFGVWRGSQNVLKNIQSIFLTEFQVEEDHIVTLLLEFFESRSAILRGHAFVTHGFERQHQGALDVPFVINNEDVHLE